MSDQDSRDGGPRTELTRRAVLGSGLLGGALAIAGPALSGIAVAAPPERAQPVSGSAGSGPAAGSEAAAAPAPAAPFELEEVSIADLQAGLQSGKYTSRGLVEKYLARIESLDRQGPELRAVLETNPEALSVADALDAERKAKGPRGPLHGIPILLKDNIGTADRMTTTAGSLALAGSIPPRDAFVAQRLREAGAVLLGKTNLSEWANFRSTHSSSGWSGRGGQCRNPYALDRTPSGSSSGSAAATAAGYAAAAVGSETDGSIVSPSAACSLVGIKPTLGLISRSGVIPIAHSQDTAGPMARTVADAAVLLGAMTGIDPSDPETAASRGKAHGDYTRFLDAAGLRGARLGVARKRYMGYSPAADRLAEAAIDAMKRQGAVIVDPAYIDTAGQFDDTELEVLLYEFKADLDRYLAGLGAAAPVHSLFELIAWNDRHRAEEMPFFGQELFVRAQAKGPLTSPDYRKALAKNRRLSREKGIDATLAKHRLDAIVAPTGGPPWLIDLVNGDSDSGGSSSPAAVAGYASITVPIGYASGLPVGLSFIGGAFSEPTLLKLAFSLEQATKHRRPPQFRPTADLPRPAAPSA
ncbi:MAG TPA: amidase [Thermoanaerobaculia bacterium]|nr:amidase [Thermoanaerobaculia bacterium]